MDDGDVNNSTGENSIIVVNKIHRTPPRNVSLSQQTLPANDVSVFNKNPQTPPKSNTSKPPADVRNVSKKSISPPNRSRSKSKSSPKVSKGHRSSSVVSTSRDRTNSVTTVNKRKRHNTSQKDRTCAVCDNVFVSTDQDSVNCDCCQAWYHSRCVNLSLAELKAIALLADKIMWYCPGCKLGAENLHKANIMFNERINSLENSVKKIENTTTNIKSEQKSMKEDIQLVKTKHSNDITKVEELIETNKGYIDVNSSDIKHNTTRINEVKANIGTLNLKVDNLQQNMLNNLRDEIKADNELNIVIPENTVNAETQLANIKSQIDEYTNQKLQEIRDAEFPRLTPSTETASNASNQIPTQTYYQRFSSAVRDEFNELEEIKRRKNQLLIMNLKESRNSTEDVTKIHELFNLLKLDKEVIITEAIRLGEKRRDSKPRFIRVTVQDLETRRKILAKATSLRNVPDGNDFARVYIKPNLTKQQNEQSKNLQEDLRQRKLANPNKSFKISKGKIVEINKTQ